MKKVLLALSLTIIFMSAVAYCNEAIAATFTWTNPTAREDGTPLQPGEIAGYRIYWGQDGDYQNTIIVEGMRTAHIEALPVGTHTAVITVVDSDGRESLYSNEVLVDIPKSLISPIINFKITP